MVPSQQQTGQPVTADERFRVEGAWMVRPCEMYREEYRDCTMLRSRFHQLFTTGEKRDCSDWKEDYENCLLWNRDYKDSTALAQIVKNEKKRIAHRVNTVISNDVWQLRSEPPAEWTAPLPEKLRGLQAVGSLLGKLKVKGGKQSNEENPPLEEVFK